MENYTIKLWVNIGYTNKINWIWAMPTKWDCDTCTLMTFFKNVMYSLVYDFMVLISLCNSILLNYGWNDYRLSLWSNHWNLRLLFNTSGMWYESSGKDKISEGCFKPNWKYCLISLLGKGQVHSSSCARTTLPPLLDDVKKAKQIEDIAVPLMRGHPFPNMQELA